MALGTEVQGTPWHSPLEYNLLSKNRGTLLNYKKGFGFMIVLRLPHLVLVILCAFGTAIDAYNLNTKRPAEDLGPLGVTIDYGFAKTSSKRGRNSVGYEFAKARVLNPLLLCQNVWNDIKSLDLVHLNNGCCGEVLAAQLYYTKYNRPSDLRLDEVNPGAATVRNGKPVPPCGQEKVDTWGCNLFVAGERIKYMDPNAPMEDYDLAAITGKLPDVTQIPLCST
ncbi:hypothetical protein BDW60DRAFT_212614 [Aspergillus nidulans var. acristatus]